MRPPSRADLIGELQRLTAENERLKRLVQTQRPELRSLREIEVGLRDYLFNGVPTLTRIHEACQALLPGNDDLSSLAEIRGILSDGKDRVDAFLAAPAAVREGP